MTKEKQLKTAIDRFNDHCGYDENDNNYVGIDVVCPGPTKRYTITVHSGSIHISGHIRLTISEALVFVNGMMAARELYD